VFDADRHVAKASAVAWNTALAMAGATPTIETSPSPLEDATGKALLEPRLYATR
jgi:hypothetical protein